MPTDFAFRFSTYLTLALACACLGYAEWDYLPAVSVAAGLVAALLVVAFRAEGRFALSLTAANVVGGGLFLAAGLWIAHHWRQENSLIHTLPWPAGLLPFLGPVVMAGLVAKLFRPKHAGDWWFMHGTGVAAVGLASSLADDAGFVALLLAYAAAGVWSLTLFYQRRTAGLIPPVPPVRPAAGVFDLSAWFPWLFGGGDPPPVVAGPPPDRSRPAAENRFGRTQLGKALRWLVAAAAVALPLFFLTPRSEGVRWQLGKGNLVSGYAPEAVIDVARSGELEISYEPAFEVTARDFRTREPRDDLPPDQLWRGASYVVYQQGRWHRGTGAAQAGGGPRQVWAATGSAARPGGGLPDLGPAAVELEFRLTDRVGRLVLAAPVAFDPGRPSPLVHEAAGTRLNGTQAWDGSFVPAVTGRPRVTRYWQAYRPPAEPGLGPPFERSAAPDALDPLLAPPPERVAVLSRQLLDRLVREGKLPKGVDERRDPVSLLPDPRDHRAVAEAFRDHLAGPEYRYTQTLPRPNPGLDPIEDFLVHSKEGHCQRFATALALLLRGAGIPSAFVLGFRGCEPVGDGRYVVREQHAHAWAETLVPAPPAPGQQHPRYQWLLLDPSPAGGDDPTPSEGGGLWRSARETGRRFFAEYVIGLTADGQKRLTDGAAEAVAAGGRRFAVGGGVLAGLAVVAVLVRRRLGRPAGPPAGPDPAPWFTRMAAALAARGLPLPPGMTPREYARWAAAVLADAPATAAVAGVPARVAEAVYEARYAGRPLPADRAAELDRDVDRLAAALRAVPAGGERWHRPPRG